MCPGDKLFDGPSGPPMFALLTCEHGGREVPDAYQHLFTGHDATLDSHRGYDIGALGVALRMASRLSTPIIFSNVTRLLVDLNRSPDNPGAFSEFTKDLPADQRDSILREYHTPHRESVTRTVAAVISGGHRVIHLGVHSCTDVLNGSVRDLDIALLFDKTRDLETAFCERYRASLRRHDPDMRYPFNEPYRGADDGLTTTLRSRFAPDRYLGVEIELRQGMVVEPAEQRAVGDLLADALRRTLRR